MAQGLFQVEEGGGNRKKKPVFDEGEREHQLLAPIYKFLFTVRTYAQTLQFAEAYLFEAPPSFPLLTHFVVVCAYLSPYFFRDTQFQTILCRPIGGCACVFFALFCVSFLTNVELRMP